MKTIAIVNEKGGTGKTTTAVNLAAALGEMGQRVLLVDLDGQAASSRWLGVEEDSRLADALLKGSGLKPLENVIPGVSLAPASGKLDSVSHDLRPTQGGQLRKVLAEVADDYDFVLIDCPPSLGNRLIGNGLLAATHAIVPVEMSILALDGLRILLTTLDDIRDGFDHQIELIGILACRYEPRTRLSRLILSELRDALGKKVFATVVRETVRMQECPVSCESILDYAPHCHAATDYRALARELVCGADESPADEVVNGDLATEPELTESEKLSVVDFRKQAYEGLIRTSRKSAGTDSQPVPASAPTEQVTEPASPQTEEEEEESQLAVSEQVAPPLPVDSPGEEEAESPEAPPTESQPVEVLCEMTGEDEDHVAVATEDEDAPQDAETPDVEEGGLFEEPPAPQEAPFGPDDFAKTRFDDWQGTVLLSESRRGNNRKRAILASTAIVAIVAGVVLVRWSLDQAGLTPQSAVADEAAMQLQSPYPEQDEFVGDTALPDATAEPKTPAAPPAAQDSSPSSQDSQPAPAADQADPAVIADRADPTPKPDAEPITGAADPAPPSPKEQPDAADTSEPDRRHRPPGFSVSGIMSSSTDTGAVVNGQWVRVGDTVSGAKVISILPSAVELELDGERFTVGLGEDSADAVVPVEPPAESD